jgi:hypothetical protein
VSICCVTFIVFMLAVELLWFIAPDIKSELIVENADPTERYGKYTYNHCCGSGKFIPDPDFFLSRIYIKECKYFNPKNCFLSSRKYNPGCSSLIRIPDTDPDFYPSRIPDPSAWLRNFFKFWPMMKLSCLFHICAFLRYLFLNDIYTGFKKTRYNPISVSLLLRLNYLNHFEYW